MLAACHGECMHGRPHCNRGHARDARHVRLVRIGAAPAVLLRRGHCLQPDGNILRVRHGADNVEAGVLDADALVDEELEHVARIGTAVRLSTVNEFVLRVAAHIGQADVEEALVVVVLAVTAELLDAPLQQQRAVHTHHTARFFLLRPGKVAAESSARIRQPRLGRSHSRTIQRISE